MKNYREHFKVGKWYVCRHSGSECTFRPTDNKTLWFQLDVIGRPVLILEILDKSDYGSGVQNYADCKVFFKEDMFLTCMWDGAYEEI